MAIGSGFGRIKKSVAVVFLIKVFRNPSGETEKNKGK
jgi:hypothetical protein